MTRLLMTTMMAAVILVATPGSVFAQPANDSALTPTVIGSLPFEDTLDTTTATTDASDPTSCATVTHTVWYTFNAGPSGNSHVIVDTVGSTYDTFVGVSTGSPGGPNVTCGESSAVFPAAPSTTYYIMVGDHGNTGGTLHLTAIQGVVFGGSVDAVASLNVRTGAVTVTGTYTCNLASTVTRVIVDLREVIGAVVISGNGDATPNATCAPGIAYAWTVEIPPTGRRFVVGRATATLEVAGADESGEPWATTVGSFSVSIRK